MHNKFICAFCYRLRSARYVPTGDIKILISVVKGTTQGEQGNRSLPRNRQKL